jgi:hypothetical protein
MKVTFPAFVIFLFTSIVLPGQSNTCNEVTSLVKRVLNSSSVQLYDSKIIGACIDTNQTMHLTLTMSNKYSIVLLGSGLSKKQTVLTQTMMPFFTSVQKIYNRFSDLRNYKMYFVYFEDEIDRFGNKIGKKKRFNSVLSMSKETADKVNWKYVGDNLRSSIWFYNEKEVYRFINMLDLFKAGDAIN